MRMRRRLTYLARWILRVRVMLAVAAVAAFALLAPAASAEAFAAAGPDGAGPSGAARAYIHLEPIPQYAYVGQTVTFTGWLYSGDRPLAYKTVKVLEDDPLVPDQTLGYGLTDHDGRFSITWPVRAGLVETDFDIYAAFDGDSSYDRARTANQQMSVFKYGGLLSLDPLPGSVKAGQTVTFSGTLRLAGASPEGAVIYVKDEDPLGPDDLLVTGYVGADGRFSATWFADYVDADSTVDVYAVFEGNSHFYRLTTCDAGPTMPFGGSCLHTVPLTIRDYSDPAYAPEAGDGEYIELYYSLPFRDLPHVAIVPSPDSYDSVRGHVVPIMEGIDTWVRSLEREYGEGDWDVTYEVVPPGKAFYSSKPDVIVNLVTHEQDEGCARDYYGWASVSRTPSKPVQTTVCSTYGGAVLPNEAVALTAGHEFAHAVGLGHAFNRPGDPMCSVEDGVPTCGRSGEQSWIPSSLNLGGLARLYGSDGFPNPNYYVEYGTRHAGDDLDQAQQRDPPTNPSAPAHGCTTDDARYNATVEDRAIDSGWYLWYTICNTGALQYSFSTTSQYDGFLLFLVTPDSDVEGFIEDGTGAYYTCEEYGTHWHKRSNTCHVESGTKVVLYNDSSRSITINGWMRT